MVNINRMIHFHLAMNNKFNVVDQEELLSKVTTSLLQRNGNRYGKEKIKSLNEY